MFNIFLLGLLTLSSATDVNLENSQAPMIIESDYADFWNGFIIGMQVNSSSPSACVKSYSTVRASFKTLKTSFNDFNINSEFTFINNFNNFVNQFVSSYDICNYSGIAKNYLNSPETALLNFLVNLTGNIAEIIPVYQNLVISFNGHNLETTGVYFGQLVRLCTGISL